MEAKKTDYVACPSPGCQVYLTRAGHVTDVVKMKCPPPSFIKKVDKERYVDTRDGVIKDYKIGTGRRLDNLDSIKKTLKKIREYVNANAVYPERLRWVTLTYAENMQDSNRLYKDFDSFRKRLERYCKKEGFSIPEYLSVIEPQGRGAWHVHVIYIFPEKAPFIPNATFAELWGHGFTKITAVNECDNLGTYFGAYLADVSIEDYEGPLDDGIELKLVKDEEGKEKKYVKGGRLWMYPKGMQIFRHSRGVTKPIKEKMSYQNFEKKRPELGTLTYLQTFELVDEKDKGSVKNVITKESYNRARK